MAWGCDTIWRNEHHFLGPYKLMSQAQQEMNAMGAQIPAWQVQGWEFNAKGEIIVMMVRSVEVKPNEEAST